MKKILIAVVGAAIGCALSGCTSDQLKAEHQTERQALASTQKADRQVERAQKAVATTTAASAAAKANLVAKQQTQRQADAALQQLVCPEPSQ